MYLETRKELKVGNLEKPMGAAYLAGRGRQGRGARSRECEGRQRDTRWPRVRVDSVSPSRSRWKLFLLFSKAYCRVLCEMLFCGRFPASWSESLCTTVRPQGPLLPPKPTPTVCPGRTGAQGCHVCGRAEFTCLQGPHRRQGPPFFPRGCSPGSETAGLTHL